MKRAWIAVVLAGASVAACAPVRPHERQRLAHPAMAAPAWPDVDRGERHVRSIREGTDGASLEGGGGCGCN